ncbi:MAG: PAS domain-containing protein, partial [Candidatus Binataceae bacterium]
MAAAPKSSERRNCGIFSSSEQGLAESGLKFAAPDQTGAAGAAEPWVARLMRPGVILLIVFEILAFTGAIFLMPEIAARTLPFELFNIAAAAICLALTWTLWFRHHWRITAFLLCSILVVSGAWISLITGKSEPLLMMVILLLVGAGSLIPWDQRWQAALSLLCVIWLAINALYSPAQGAAEFYRWLVLLAAAALAYCCTSLTRRYRHDLMAQLRALENSHERLRAEAQQRERGAAERASAELKLGEKEATLRKTFEVSLDALSVNRLYAGTFVDFNEEFLRIVGYSREQVIGHTAHELRLFANHERQQELMRHLLSQGSIRNMEFEFRHKSGRIVPALISSIAIELSGELCVVSAVRDISDWKRTERELLDAHQGLSAQVNELKENRRRLAESEDKLRKIFDASLDVISIRRLQDGRFVDVNPEFERVTGYSKDEALKLNIFEIGIWDEETERDKFFQQLREHGSARNFEAKFRSRGGELQ